MGVDSVTVTFEPQGRAVRVHPGVTVREAAARAGVFLDYPCGGQGTCGKCRVRMSADSGQLTSVERDLLPESERRHGMRLACQCVVKDSLTVTVPETSLLASSYKILSEASATTHAADDPPIRKQLVNLPTPVLADDCADFERLQRVLGPVSADLDLLAALPAFLRTHGFSGTAVVADGRLLDVESDDTAASCHVAAVDIGTTTLVAALLDLVTGNELARVSRMNPQTSLGDDVLTRILHAREGGDGLRELQRDVVLAVDAMLAELAAQAGIHAADIYEVTVAGNTTMQHLFAGLDPSALGEIPFAPAISAPMQIPAEGLGLTIHARGIVHVFPVIGGFVGGDTVAGLLATDLDQAAAPTLLIDIGTNGELVLQKDGELWATSCAAGPAFEGARIAHGMRAAAGAIESVSFNGDVRCETIGDATPVGICGSGLIDAAAGLLRSGIVLPQGLMLDRDQAPETVPASIRERIVDGPKGPEFVLVSGHESATGHPIVITQVDMRELQLATAAIRSGTAILLKRAGIGASDLQHVLVAGAFGNYVRCENAQRIGLLPHNVAPSRLTFVGNASLAGARRAAVSSGARGLAESLARRTRHIDLSLDPEFHETYVECMFFPEDEATETLPADHP